MSRALAVRILAVAVLVLGSGFVTQQVVRYPGSEHEGAAFEIRSIVPGVYHALGTGAMSVGANAVIVEGDRDLLIVDTNVSPAAAATLREELRAVVDKPIRTVVNTHFHYDHAHGNQIYGPDVEIIGHEFTREMMAAGRSMSGRTYDNMVRPLPSRIAALEAQRDTTGDAAARATLARQIAVQQAYRAATDAVTPVPPNTTLSSRLTLQRGGREIRILFLGRAHTGGDVVVHLPADRVLITGDMLSSNPPYMGDGYPVEWVETLEQLKALDFDWIVPGHGPAFQDRAKIDQLQAYLRDFWSRARALHATGVGSAEAARRIDMRDHAGAFPSIRAAGVNALGIERAYELLDGGT
jgi:glyoxylase-like metal-dependent hydrolase (beta-lactamase superfamily II)